MFTAALGWLEKHNRSSQFLLGLGVFLPLAYSLLAVNGILPYVSLSRIHLIVTPFAELLFILILVDTYKRNKGNVHLNLWAFLFLFSLANLGLAGYFYHFYTTQAVPDAASVSLVLQGAPYGFIALSIALVVSFYFGFRGIFALIWQKFTYEGGQIPEKWIPILLGLFFLVGVGLRLYNLGGFPPYVDEYIHTNQAFSLYGGNGWEWDRAYLTVTWPVYFSFLGFGVNLWAARLPMIFINMLAIFPLYWLGRRINPAVGLICAALFVFSPWIIASSRTVRDYAVVPVFFYTAALFLLELMDWDGLRPVEYLKKNIYKILVTVLILVYAVYDKTSILKVIVALYGIFAFLAFLKLLKQGMPRRFQVVLLGLLGVVLAALFVYSRFLNRFLASGTLSYDQTSRFWDTLVSSPINQWYFIGAIGYLVLGTAVFMAGHAFLKPYHKTRFSALFFVLAFLSLLFYLSFFLVSPHVPERTRYGVLMEYWYLPVVAIFIWMLYRALRTALHQLPAVVWALLVGFLFSNLNSIQQVITYQGGDTLVVTGEKHYIVEPAHQFLAENMTSKDVLLTEFVHSYDLLAGDELQFRGVISYYNYVFRNDQSPLKVVEENPRGWIALSRNARPANNGLPSEDFIHAGRLVEYIGLVGEIHLWRWGN